MALLLPSPDPSLPQNVQDELSSAYAAIQTAYAVLAQAQVSGLWVEQPFVASDFYPHDSADTWGVVRDATVGFLSGLSYIVLAPTTLLLNIAVTQSTFHSGGGPSDTLYVKLPGGYVCGEAGQVATYYTGYCQITQAGSVPGRLQVGTGSSLMSISKEDFSSFSNGTLTLSGQVIIRVRATP